MGKTQLGIIRCFFEMNLKICSRRRLSSGEWDDGFKKDIFQVFSKSGNHNTAPTGGKPKYIIFIRKGILLHFIVQMFALICPEVRSAMQPSQKLLTHSKILHQTEKEILMYGPSLFAPFCRRDNTNGSRNWATNSGETDRGSVAILQQLFQD
jgi:hypothetical protein